MGVGVTMSSKVEPFKIFMEGPLNEVGDLFGVHLVRCDTEATVKTLQQNVCSTTLIEHVS